MPALPPRFPFRRAFEEFLDVYAQCRTYWYVPKTRSMSDNNVQALRVILSVIAEQFLDRLWNPGTQDALLKHLTGLGTLEPYIEDAGLLDRTALIRIWKKWLETLGLLWVQKNKQIIMTEAGRSVIATELPRQVIEGQIVKLQYPNPSLTVPYRSDFKGILPHLFSLQVLQKCDYRLSLDEYELFLNLAQSQEDLSKIVRYVRYWRDLAEREREQLLKVARQVPMRGAAGVTRYQRVHLNSSYQRAFFTYPHYLDITTNGEGAVVRCRAPGQIDTLITEKIALLKLTSFESLADWFAYYGDPRRQPSWYTYLISEVERAQTPEDAQRLVARHRRHLTELEAEEIRRSEVEKGIETFYVNNLHLLEPGLRLVARGRQYATPIGRMGLLCRGGDGKYVVVELKAEEADDAVFGQILRYIGWVHRNMQGGENNVRGIIVAPRFPEKARFSQIGLLRSDYQHFLRFKEYQL